jgi:hypothetical protein
MSCTKSFLSATIVREGFSRGNIRRAIIMLVCLSAGLGAV